MKNNQPLTDSRKLFQKVCKEFRPYFKRQSIKTVKSPIKIIKESFKAIREINLIYVFGLFNPMDEMIAILQNFDRDHLNAIKQLSEINVRMHKDRLSGNPILKLAVALSAALALVKGIAELSYDPEPIKWIMESALSQYILENLYLMFIIQLPILGIMYIFFLFPSLLRAQLIDDVITIAYQNKSIESSNSKTKHDNRIKSDCNSAG